jgi:glucan phosphoethanolaminetransferase (alkaline phosphatase superfamily)
MGKIVGILVLLAAVVVAVYLWTQSGGTVTGGNVFEVLMAAIGFGKQAGGVVVTTAKPTFSELVSQPWFYSVLIVGVLTWLAIRTWNKIGPWGRGLLMVVATIFVTITVASYR